MGTAPSLAMPERMMGAIMGKDAKKRLPNTADFLEGVASKLDAFKMGEMLADVIQSKETPERERQQLMLLLARMMITHEKSKPPEAAGDLAAMTEQELLRSLENDFNLVLKDATKIVETAAAQ